jgi:hypothetical protein
LDDANRKARAVADHIVDYLRAHPQAADTARGIAEWWLAGRAFDAALVNRALRMLAAEGHVVSETNPDGNRIWRAGPTIRARCDGSPPDGG